ncbi:MAG TPA: amidohydrolase [Nevskiaceae bacterium]|nr:amidohydrolase [Nevskiaceae bacterium]
MRACRLAVLVMLLGLTPSAGAQSALQARVDALIPTVEAGVIADRRHFHQHPELGNREFKTSAFIAKRLKSLGYEVRTGVAKTGVVGTLRGGKPGPVVALRADMDALPVVEEVDLPFASKVRTTFDGKDVGVMHACGHDAHMAILLGVAKVLADVREDLPGTVKLIFQPAEEGAPEGEEGGAKLMVQEGVLRDEPKPSAIFGLHVFSFYDAGTLAWRAGGLLASSDTMLVTVKGRQTHGAMPWQGVDPITVAAQIVLALQTIPSRQMDITKAPTLISIGKIEGGVRNNIIPDEVVMKGTIRALDPAMRTALMERITRTATEIAASAGATATVEFGKEVAYPVTFNDPALTERMQPTLARATKGAKLVQADPIMGAEDFSFFAQEIPGLYLALGSRKPGTPAAEAPANHSPKFHLDESGMLLGVRALADLAVDYLASAPAPLAP